MKADTDLLRLYSDSRDESAFAELVKRHLDGVYSAALRRLAGDTHLAEDVAQKVFVELARQSRQLRHHPVLSGWLYTATRNHAAKAVRTEQRRRARENQAYVMNEMIHDGSNQADDWAKIAPLLDAAMDQLSEKDRTAVLLRFIDRKSFVDIGAQLHVSDDAARMRVDRALEKLRLHLTRRGVVSSAVALGATLANHAVSAAPASLSTAITAAAVATAPATLGAFASALHFMTTSKLIGSAMAAALIFAALGTSERELQAARAAEGKLLTARREQDSDELRLKHIRARNAEMVTLCSELEKQIESLHSAEKEFAEAQKSEPSPARDPKAEGKAFVERHPEVKQALIAWIDARTNYRWGKLLGSSALTAGQREEFRVLMREGSWFGRGLDSNGNNQVQISADTGMSWQEKNAKLRTLLGKAGYQKYITLSVEAPMAELVTQTASALVFTDQPLSPEQADRLTATMVTKAIQRPRTPALINWEATLTEAETFLSPTQLGVLRGMRARDEYQKALNSQALAHPESSLPVASKFP